MVRVMLLVPTSASTVDGARVIVNGPAPSAARFNRTATFLISTFVCAAVSRADWKAVLKCCSVIATRTLPSWISVLTVAKPGTVWLGLLWLPEEPEPPDEPPSSAPVPPRKA